MDKDTYLRFLKALLLNRVPTADAEDIVRFYTEYFEDAGLDKEADVMAALGSPEELVAKIMEQRVREEAEGIRPKSRNTENTYEAIYHLPFWGRVAVLILAWIWLLPTVGCLLLAFGIGGIALIVCGACAIGIGVGILAGGLGSKLLMIGIALVLISIGVLLVQGANGFEGILKSACEKSREILGRGDAFYETVH